MKISVPFFKQTDPTNCVPTVLRMILAYFDSDPGIDFCESKTGFISGKAAPTIWIATAAASLGYKAKFFSTSLRINEKNLGTDYYRDYSPSKDLLSQSVQWIEKAKGAGVFLQESSISLQVLLGYLSENSIPAVLLDWNVVNDKTEKGYLGHTVPIVGYDDDFVYVHDPGMSDPRPFVPISRDLFNKARKALGTDEDFVVISCN